MEDNKLKDRAIKLFESNNIRKIIIIAGIIGVLLIFLSSYIDIGAAAEKKEDGEFSVTTYSTEIQSDLEGIISKIEGAGKTYVLLTIENSVEYVYLEDSTTKTKEIEPLIRGVLVVCQGGNDPTVVESVTNAVTKALDISTAKVCIAKLSE
ncbi:MAG: hypothetical protein U0L20_05020 [Ruminococcus sp.]|nr:hypothetical protein [Ruminococcus sp.]